MDIHSFSLKAVQNNLYNKDLIDDNLLESYISNIHSIYFEDLFSSDIIQFIFDNSSNSNENQIVYYLFMLIKEVMEYYSKKEDEILNTCQLFQSISNPSYYEDLDINKIDAYCCTFLESLLGCHRLRFNN
ncbi:hypothetical protein K502DRAFT_65090 [Neoconidiobolus thromboides FSU 785]|nr:hypothetical protein K502DRAFT_65090 [Neoconidiobolus thromboides FSU 785]